MFKEIDGLVQETDSRKEPLALLRESSLRISEHLESRSLWQAVADQACLLTRAQYGALLTFDETGESVEFVTSGMSPDQARLIPRSPRGRGILGSINGSDRPVRIKDIGSHPDSVGFPENHPIMKSFLGMPIRHRGKLLANLYLADKEGCPEFTAEDEEIVVTFVEQAAIAMENASKYERAVRAKSDLETLVNISPVGVVVFDAITGQLMFFNKETERIFGDMGVPSSSWEEALKEVSFRRADGREISLNELPLSRVLRSGETVRAEEIVIFMPDGRSVTVLINAAPIYSDQGEIISVVVALQDMSPIKETDRMQSDFLGLLSNGLRTPLNTMKGSISALTDVIAQSSTTESRQLLKIIDLQTDMMRSQINGLVDLTQIETGTLNITPTVTDILSLLKEVRCEFLRCNSGHEISLNTPGDLPKVMADQQRIGQVLHTLLRCGVRYSPPSSSMKVNVQQEGVHVAVSISVDGPILPSSELRGTFQELSKDQVKGAGLSKEDDKLALMICKGILSAHGGRLWADFGETAQGMTLGFSVPIADEAEKRPEPSSMPANSRSLPVEGAKARILSVVDSPRMLGAVQRTLSRAGYVPIGSLDVADVDRLITDEKPHLVLLDLAEPRIKHFELIQKITQGYGVPAIVLSGQGDDDSIVRAFEMGADDYIVKPFSPSELVARIKAAFRKRPDSFQARRREEYVIGDVVINYSERKVTVSGRKVHLTATEYQLLFELSTRAGRVLSQDELLRRIWGEEYTGDIQLLRAFVKTLRQKLGDNARRPTYIFTEHGIGYRMPKP